MKDPKSTIRYFGFLAFKDGSRRFDFSFSGPDSSLKLISVEAPYELFSGPNQIAIQGCAGICYKTLKWTGRIMTRFITKELRVHVTQAREGLNAHVKLLTTNSTPPLPEMSF